MRKFVVAAALAFALPLSAAELQISVQLPAFAEGPYHRPYVAVWVEDAAEKPVRLIEIWREKPDWIKDLRRFWRKTGRADQALVDGRTGATKGPGTYTLRWDGKDDQGQELAAGSYQLVVEAAREHGGRQLLKQKFNWDGSAVQIKMAPGAELGTVELKSQ